MSNWDRVKAHLERQGLMTAEGVTRRVSARACRDCHTRTLGGLDGDLCARDVRVDPEPLSPAGEALAYLTGRSTWALHHLGGRYELTQRSSFTIAGEPAGSGRFDVLAEHHCGAVALPTRPSAFETTGRGRCDGPPPF